MPKKSEEKPALPNEIRITASGKVNSIIGYALRLLSDVRQDLFLLCVHTEDFMFRNKRLMSRLF